MEGRRWPQSFPGWGPQEEAQRTGQRETAAQGPGVRGSQNQNRAGGWQVLGEAGLWPEGGASGSPRSSPRKATRTQNSPWAKSCLGEGDEGGRGATTGCATEADAPPSRQHAPASKDPHVCSQKGCLNGAPNRNWTPRPQAPAARE